MSSADVACRTDDTKGADAAIARALEAATLAHVGVSVRAAVGSEHERHVRVARSREAEQLGEQDLSRRRVEQVGAAHDLADPLVCVIDDDGELVCRHPVRAAHDEVVDGAGVAPGQTILELDHLAIGPHPECVPRSVGDPPPGLQRLNRRTGPLVGPFGKLAVRR